MAVLFSCCIDQERYSGSDKPGCRYRAPKARIAVCTPDEFGHLGEIRRAQAVTVPNNVCTEGIAKNRYEEPSACEQEESALEPPPQRDTCK